jgi:hypothetical protein
VLPTTLVLGALAGAVAPGRSTVTVIVCPPRRCVAALSVAARSPAAHHRASHLGGLGRRPPEERPPLLPARARHSKRTRVAPARGHGTGGETVFHERPPRGSKKCPRC